MGVNWVKCFKQLIFGTNTLLNRGILIYFHLCISHGSLLAVCTHKFAILICPGLLLCLIEAVRFLSCAKRMDNLLNTLFCS